MWKLQKCVIPSSFKKQHGFSLSICNLVTLSEINNQNSFNSQLTPGSHWVESELEIEYD